MEAPGCHGERFQRHCRPRWATVRQRCLRRIRGAESAQETANNRLAYPFTIPGFGTFDRQVSGQKIYDFNVDGLAHIGLLPDMVDDLKNIGVTDQQLQPLFGSAQAYIHMWSCCVSRARARR